MSPHVLALPARTTKGDASSSARTAVPTALFLERTMNNRAKEPAQSKKGRLTADLSDNPTWRF
jgi:hypothetical protein